MFGKKRGKHWVDDKDATACNSCTSTFTLTNGKHHCRVCGGLFCGNCARHTPPLGGSCLALHACVAAAATTDDDLGAADDDDDEGADPELEPKPYNVGLPQTVIFWQSAPRNVVVIVAEKNTRSPASTTQA